jgi:hypothetical protein
MAVRADKLQPEEGTDGWCTPAWLAEVLGPFDLDPCSNARSHIRACERRARERGEDGLAERWGRRVVFVNPPYSSVLPWASKLADHDGPWVALLKLDPTTRWWATLMSAAPTVAPFRGRIKFESGVGRDMTANFPSVLVWSAWRPPAALIPHLWLPTYERSKPPIPGGRHAEAR